MVLAIILGIILLITLIACGILIAVGGPLMIFVFGDVFVCCFILYWIIRAIIRKKS